jgi:hypothetical protein
VLAILQTFICLYTYINIYTCRRIFCFTRYENCSVLLPIYTVATTVKPMYKYCHRSRDNSIGIVYLRATVSKSGVYFPAGASVSSPQREDRLWGPAIRYRGLFPPRVKFPGLKADHSLLSSDEVWNGGAIIPPLPQYIFMACCLIT